MMTNKNWVLVDALTLVLKELGVEFVFGVSGANIEHFHDAIYRLGDDKLTAILAKSEFSAAFMADGRARAHRTLGVCCATSGGGMTNLAVGIAEAYADNVPLLAIVGQPPTQLEGKGAFQDSSGENKTVDGLSFWRSITKYAAKITQAAQFWECLEQALKHLFQGNLGPCALLIPRDLFTTQVPARPAYFSTKLSDYQSVCSVDRRLILKLDHLLAASRKPLIIIGKYARFHDFRLGIKRFVTHFDCRVATTIADVNAFSHADSHYLGMVGVCGHPQAHSFIKDEADLIIVLEDDLSVMTTASIQSYLNEKTLVFLGLDSTKARAAASIDLVIEGAPCDILASVAYSDRRVSLAHPKREMKMPATQSAIASSEPAPQMGLSVNHTIPVIESVLPHVDTVVFDAGNCVTSVLHHLTLPEKITTLIALGMGGMGYAIPAAIGAQIGYKKRRKTLVFTGDGGFFITGLEVHTAIEYSLPILFIVFNNSSHGMCVTRQQLYFSNRIIASRYRNIDITQVVKGLGDATRLWCACANDVQGLHYSLDDYYTQHSHMPGVLEIKIAMDEMPPFVPFLERKSQLEGRKGN